VEHGGSHGPRLAPRDERLARGRARAGAPRERRQRGQLLLELPRRQRRRRGGSAAAAATAASRSPAA